MDGLGDAPDCPPSPISSSLGTSPSTASRDAASDFVALEIAVEAIPCEATRSALRLLARFINATTSSRSVADSVESNLLRLMTHLGVSPAAERSGAGRLGSGLASAGASSTGQYIPHCPLCNSSKFSNEKNLVQHLNTALSNFSVAASSSKSCRFDANFHCRLMGVNVDSCDQQSAIDFINGYRNCFLASCKSGFNIARCSAAAQYLITAALPK